MLFFFKLTQTALVCLFVLSVTLSECRNPWDVVVKGEGWEPTLPCQRPRGKNTPYFDLVAEAQNIIRKESHEVLGALLHSIKSEANGVLIPHQILILLEYFTLCQLDNNGTVIKRKYHCCFCRSI